MAYVCNSNITEVNARGTEFSINLKSIVSLENPVSKAKMTHLLKKYCRCKHSLVMPFDSHFPIFKWK